MRHVVFVGNCQVAALARLYRDFAGEGRGERVTYAPYYNGPAEARAVTIEDADVLVSQVFDFDDADAALRRTAAGKRFRVPVASANFFWPFAGRPHPRNGAFPGLPDGPYPTELGDTFLNRLIGRGATPDEAVAAYLALDFGSRTDLDRLHELWLEQQRKRDAGTGIAIAEAVEAHFRNEPTFLTPYHPELRVFCVLMDGLFAQMGVDRATLGRMRASLRQSPFPQEALPIHPTVARHFGMRWVKPSTRYRFLHEGGFTFEEYCRRYAGFTWNAALMEGVGLAHADDLERAERLLVEGLAIAPGAVDGWRSLSLVLDRRGRAEEALAAVERGLAIDPADRECLLQLGRLHMQAGRQEAAGAVLARVAAMRPGWTHALATYAEWLAARGRHEEAVAQLRAARDLDPVNPHIEVALSSAWSGRGEAGEALACLRRAVALAPEDWAFRELLAHALLHAGRREEAIGYLRGIATERPGDGGNHALLGSLLLAEHDFAGAAAALREAVALAPRRHWTRRELAEALEGLGRFDDAVTELGIALRIAPQDAHLWVALGHTHWHRHRLAEAEACFRHSAALDPATTGFREARDLVVAQAAALAEREAAEMAGAAQADPFAGVDRTRLGMTIQSIGRNCEFGGIQRERLGVEPISLLRWAGSEYGALVRALRERFAGLAEAMTGEAVPEGEPPERQHWWLHDDCYGIVFHTDEVVAAMPAEAALQRVRGRLRRAAAMQVESIAGAEKLFLYSDATLARPGQAAALFDALRAIGPQAWLLVVIADAAKAGTAELVGEGFIAGYVDRLTEARSANDYEWRHWPAMLAAAWRLWPGSEEGRLAA